MNALHLALLVGVATGLGLLGCFGLRGRMKQMAAWGAAASVLAGVSLAQFSAAFDGYDTDYWTYAVIVERVADGRGLLDREPFRLEPPPSPHLSTLWLVLGLTRRLLPLSTSALMRALAAVSIVLLSFGAWRVASRLMPDRSSRLGAVVLFWLAMPDQWWAVAMGRNLSFAFMLLAVAAALDPTPGAKSALRAGLLAGLAFHAHLFGGVLAVAAVAVVIVVRWRQGHAAGGRSLAVALGLALLVAAPCLAYGLSFLGLAKSTAHLTPRQTQVVFLGLRWLRPEQALGQLPVALAILAGVGLVLPPKPALRTARSLVRAGTLLVLLVLFTPLYHAAVEVFGGWMPMRVWLLAFPWVAATLGLTGLLESGSAFRLPRLIGAILAIALGSGAAWTLAESLEDRRLDLGEGLAAGLRPPSIGPFLPYFRFSPEAQSEAYALRRFVRGRSYLTSDLLGYGTAGPTLGRPLAVPPGHASPFSDFTLRKRWVERVVFVNTLECWAELFQREPDFEYLLTPAPGARVERTLWAWRFARDPEAVRQRLAEGGALRTVFEGRYFVLDRIRSPLPNEDLTRPATSRGRVCP